MNGVKKELLIGVCLVALMALAVVGYLLSIGYNESFPPGSVKKLLLITSPFIRAIPIESSAVDVRYYHRDRDGTCPTTQGFLYSTSDSLQIVNAKLIGFLIKEECQISSTTEHSIEAKSKRGKDILVELERSKRGITDVRIMEFED